MFLPIGDAPNPRGFRPWVNWALIGLNVLVFLLVTLPLGQSPIDPSDPAVLEYAKDLVRRLPQHTLPEILAQVSAYDLYVVAHGFKPAAPELPDLFYSLFLHGGFMHLVGNMLFLWIYGDNVEHRMGRLLYLVTYLLSGVAATVAFAAFNLDSMTPLVGASGAISGVLGLYFLMFPRNQVKVFVAFFPFLMNTIYVPARLVLGFYLVVDNLLPILFGSRSSVAFGAHLGGFVFGLGAAWAFEKVSMWSPRRGPKQNVVMRPVELRVATPLGDAIRAGDRSTALQLAIQAPLTELHDLPPDLQLRLAEWLAQTQQPELAIALLRRLLGDRSTRVDQARVYLTLGLVRLQQGQIAAAYQHLLSVLDFNPDPETEDQARSALAAIRPGLPPRS